MAGNGPAAGSSLETYSSLLQWMKSHGGDLHESVQISHNERQGTHIRAKKEGVPSNTHIIKTPVATTMSYFNAIDHRIGDVHFPSHGVKFPNSFIESARPEEVAIFFLVGQHLRGSESFWHPYLHTLPEPGTLTTLPYYEDEDLDWLEGTNLLQARKQRVAQMRQKYEDSYDELQKAGVEDSERYSWDLYLWAATIFASRAFSAKVLSGVVSELGLPEENVSVLLPFIDISNHRPLAKVEWRAGRESVDFVTLEDVAAEQEIANNYGPRNNEQLMMNYGFCLSDNPCDYRTVCLRAPPGSPLQVVREQQRQLFPDSSKDSEDPYYVFNISYPLLAPHTPIEHSIFSPALFNAVSILAANQRELETLEVSEHEIRLSNTYGNSRAALAAISQIIIELITHIIRLRSSGPGPKEPSNLKQTHAKIYRDSQIRLSESALVIAAWTLQRARVHGLTGNWEGIKQLLGDHMARIPNEKFPDAVRSRLQVKILERLSVLMATGELFSFDELLDLLPGEVREHFLVCSTAVLKNASRNIPALRGITAQASPFRFPLFVCLVVAVHITNRHKHGLGSGESHSFLPSRLSQWAGFILDHYLPPPDDVAWAVEDEDDENLLSEFDEVLAAMREQNADIFSKLEPFTGGWQGDAWWLSPNWVRWVWMMTEQECVQAPEDPLALLSSEGSGNVMLSTETYLYIPQSPQQ
ncbi:hypothetical protein BJY01DRAFT_96261 [Aspergillus pseudoustus]|uniref:SET domain-containing protein n=1 Tax=Aspergillus pseudoustus TaxID=1810923 RepID=A0ABR4KJE8_9EURO